MLAPGAPDRKGRASAGKRCGPKLALDTLKAAVKTVEMNRRLKQAGHTEAEIRDLRRGQTG